MTTPRRLRRPEPKREAVALRVAAKMRRAGFTVEPWQVDALRRIYAQYGSLNGFRLAVLADRDHIQEGLTSIKAQLRYGIAAANL